MTKEEIKKKLEEDPNWTLPDDATDEDWDVYLQVKDEMSGGKESTDEESWDEPEDTGDSTI